MLNEVLFLLVMALSLGTVLVFASFGRSWLVALPPFFLVIANIFAPQISTVFGITTGLALPLYAAIFLATDIVAEHWGKKEATKVVWLGLASQVCLVVFSQILLRADVTAFSQPLQAALQTLFAFTPRIVLGSVIAYIISQHFDVWAFHRLKHRFNSKHLWLRNNMSTVCSQLIDSTIFITIAFYGVLPVVPFILSVWLLKTFVAVMDTPFIYLSYRLVR